MNSEDEDKNGEGDEEDEEQASVEEVDAKYDPSKAAGSKVADESEENVSDSSSASNSLPTFKIKEILADGEATIQFSKTMNFSKHLKEFINFQQEVVQAYKEGKPGVTKLTDEEKILDLKIVPALDQTVENTKFRFEVKSIDEKSITLLLYFDKAIMISQFDSRDTLVARIGRPSLFPDLEGQEVPAKSVSE